MARNVQVEKGTPWQRTTQDADLQAACCGFRSTTGHKSNDERCMRKDVCDFGKTNKNSVVRHDHVRTCLGCTRDGTSLRVFIFILNVGSVMRTLVMLSSQNCKRVN